MAASSSEQQHLARPKSARLLGIFHVLFASALLMGGLCMGVYVAMMPMLSRATAGLQEGVQKQVEAARRDRLKALDEEEKGADTPAKKAAVAERRREVAAAPGTPVVAMMDFSKMGLDDPKLLAWSGAEVVTGVVLNLAMLAAGIGLLHARGWAWRLGLYTAWLKVLRLWALYVFAVLVIVPTFSKNMGDAVSAMMSQQAALRPGSPAPPADLFVKTYTIMYSIMSLLMIAGGSVYPAVTLWCLTRPGVRAACLGAPGGKPPVDPRDSW